MPISNATAHWQGGFKQGKGVMKPAHGAEVGYTAGTRFEAEAGSNPEELIGAALAGCFSMALAVGLERAGAQPRSIRTDAEVKLEKQPEGFTITGIQLTTEADVTGIEPAKFQEVAEATKKGCPVSRALGAIGDITLSAKLTAG